MIKRVNSTGRRRIPRDRVSIEVFDGVPRTFDASIDVSGFDELADAAVVLEATCAGSSVIRRFEWGTVGLLSAPSDRQLSNLHGQHVFFSLKVIDRSEQLGRILGVAENIRPIKGGEKTAVGRRGLLPVETADIGDELWRLEFRSEDVFLLVNQNVHGLADRMRFDPGLFSLVYPSVIRMILLRAIDEFSDDESEQEDAWPALWIRFGCKLHPDNSRLPSEPEEQDEWIEEVVQQFAHNHQLRDKFVSSQSGSDVWEKML